MTETTRHSTHARTYLMCPPEHFAVEYAINPWMHPDRPVDAALAMRQWQQLAEVFGSLGHTVHTITPEPGLPDMVFAANGATVIGGKVLGAQFRLSAAPAGSGRLPGLVPRARLRPHPRVADSQRGGGRHRLRRPGHPGRSRLPQRPGSGQRADRAVRPARAEPAPGGPAVLPPRHRAVSCSTPTPPPTTRPRSTTPAGRRWPSHFAELIEAKDEDAEVLGLNAISDGRHVVLPGPGDRAGRPAGGGRLRARPGGPVGAAQGRRRP